MVLFEMLEWREDGDWLFHNNTPHWASAYFSYRLALAFHCSIELQPTKSPNSKPQRHFL
jgi:hypothetical protein